MRNIIQKTKIRKKIDKTWTKNRQNSTNICQILNNNKIRQKFDKYKKITQKLDKKSTKIRPKFDKMYYPTLLRDGQIPKVIIIDFKINGIIINFI